MKRLFGMVSLVAVSTTLSGCLVASTNGGSSPAAPVSVPTATVASGAATPSGLKTCALDSLPPQASDTVEAIQQGGPYVRAKDGGTYQNRNRVLPVRAVGFYREYTVKTPGSNTAGARRIVTGGNPKTDPPWYFYTGDHYDSFCEVTGTR